MPVRPKSPASGPIQIQRQPLPFELVEADTEKPEEFRNAPKQCAGPLQSCLNLAVT